MRLVRCTSGRKNLHRCGTGCRGRTGFGTGFARAGYSKIRNMPPRLAERGWGQFPITLQGELLWPVMESAHYFSASPAGPFTRKPLTVELACETRRLQTSSGIFSPDGIDKGTAILLAEVP